MAGNKPIITREWICSFSPCGINAEMGAGTVTRNHSRHWGVFATKLLLIGVFWRVKQDSRWWWRRRQRVRQPTSVGVGALDAIAVVVESVFVVTSKAAWVDVVVLLMAERMRWLWISRENERDRLWSPPVTTAPMRPAKLGVGTELVLVQILERLLVFNLNKVNPFLLNISTPLISKSSPPWQEDPWSSPWGCWRCAYAGKASGAQNRKERRGCRSWSPRKDQSWSWDEFLVGE